MRQRREVLGYSQGRLGRHLGLTFSQIQKYEKGSNRIGAGRLFEIAKFLGVPPSYFFEGIEETSIPEGGPPTPETGEIRDDVRALISAFSAIRDPETRASITALVRSLASNGSPGSPAAG